jgi:hypothetical protein
VDGAHGGGDAAMNEDPPVVGVHASARSADRPTPIRG